MNSWLLTLLEASINMTMLILILYLVGMLFIAKFSAKWRYYIWILIIAGLLYPFRPAARNPLFTLEVPERYLKVFIAVWALGVLVSLSIKIIKYIRFVRTAKRWRNKIEDSSILDLFSAIRTKMGITENISLYECRSVTTPMLLGVRNPVILLPDIETPPDELALIMEHELTHYKHKDLLTKICSVAAQTLHWFNPFVYLMDRVMQRDCESFCDETILNGADADTRQLYGESIIGVIRKQNRYKTVFSTGFFGGVKDIKRRLVSIMSQNKKWNFLAVFMVCFSVSFILFSGMIFSACTVPVPKEAAPSAAIIDSNIDSNIDPNTDPNPSESNIPPREDIKNPSEENFISIKQAKQIVLDDIGGGTVLQCELETDDHIIQYEIEAIYKNIEYDYAIDAVKGTIIGKETDHHDDS
ncbi:MAG: hypothetical protein LBR68_02840 [Lachnoclostridium sp.]|jgi:beta-lactamase regulating signal transducer with metallopeptidase domain/uncharacterized membrane protein YkoI|nr:hypothetical protein [Lachnoclostridium sp.]